MAKTSQKAIAYIRVSTIEQASEGVSLAAQEERIKAYCTIQGLELVKVIRDEGVSASKPLAERQGGQELLKATGKGNIRHIVAVKLDRIFRDAEDALHQTKAWDAKNIALHLVDMGGQSVNTATAMGRYFLTMMAAFAELERNLIAERTATALAHKKANKEVYSPTPLGYNREGNALVENEQELQAVRFIREQRKAGLSLREIASRLNEAGIPTKKGGKWYASTVKYILENNLYREAV